MSLLVGLTGDIGSGKSFATEIFRKKSARIISADNIAREIIRAEKPEWKKIVRMFGKEVLLDSGEIDRTVLGKIIFKDQAKRKILEAILHPIIIEEEMKAYKNIISEDPNSLVILEAALLIESGNYKNVDRVIVIFCDESERLRRIKCRDELSHSDIKRRMNAQMSLSKKINYADYILENNGTKEDLEYQIDILYEKLINQIKNP